MLGTPSDLLFIPQTFADPCFGSYGEGDATGTVDRAVAESTAVSLPDPSTVDGGTRALSEADGAVLQRARESDDAGACWVPPMGSDGRPLSMLMLPGGPQCARDGEVVMVIPAGAFAMRWPTGGEAGEEAAAARRHGLDGREGVEWVLLGERVLVRRGLEGKVPVTAQHMLRPSGEVLKPIVPEDLPDHAMRAADSQAGADGELSAVDEDASEEASRREAGALERLEREAGVLAEDDPGLAQLLDEAREREARGEPQSIPREDLVPRQASAFSDQEDVPRLPNLHKLWLRSEQGEVLNPRHEMLLAHVRQCQLWASSRELRVRSQRAELLLGGMVFGREFASRLVDAHHERWKGFLRAGTEDGGEKQQEAAGYAAIGALGAPRPWRPEPGWSATRSSAAPEQEVGRVPDALAWTYYSVPAKEGKSAKDTPMRGWKRSRYERILVERREEYMRREERPDGEY